MKYKVGDRIKISNPDFHVYHGQGGTIDRASTQHTYAVQMDGGDWIANMDEEDLSPETLPAVSEFADLWEKVSK